MPNPAVSIVVASQSTESDLSSVLKSLHSQTFSDFEILVATPHALLSVSRNQAVQKASGHYLAFVDSHHTWMPAKLERQLNTLSENQDLGWCYCDAFLAQSQTRSSELALLPCGNILRPLLLKNFIPEGSVLLRRDLFEALGGFDESEHYALSEEWDLWMRLAAEHPAALTAEPLVSLNQAESSAIPDHERLQRSRRRVVESAVARNLDLLRDLRSESLAEICISAGNAYLTANQRDQARLHFAEALTHSPLRSDAYLSWVASFLPSMAQQQIRDLHNLSRQLQRAEKPKPPTKIGA